MPKQPTFIPIGPWLPDQPEYNNPGTSLAQNCVPRTENSYGPVAAPMVYSEAIHARCQGATAFIDPAGNISLLAGDATKLYELQGSGTAWTDVSKVGGYACPADQQWRFEYYNGKAIATDYADPIQVITLNGGTAFANLSSGAPKAKYLAFVKDFLAVAYTNDGSGGVQPQRVWWPALGDPTNWPTPGGTAASQVQSSYNDLFGNWGAIQGLVGNLGNADAAVFMEHAVFRMVYVGPPLVFDFLPAEGVKGCCAAGSIVQYGNVAYYLAEDGFAAFDGASSQPIGDQKFDKWFFADLDTAYINRIVGTVDPLNKHILWAYPGKGSSGGIPNRILLYNTVLGMATHLDITCETIARLYTLGYTLDELYTVLGYTLDNLPAPLDSPIWQGGNVLLGLFDTNHKLNFLTGQNLAAVLGTTEVQPAMGRRVRVTNTRPIVDGGAPLVQIGTRDRLVDGVSYTDQIAMNALGLCPARASGRYLRGQITMAAGSTFTHLQGIEIEASEAGIR